MPLRKECEILGSDGGRYEYDCLEAVTDDEVSKRLWNVGQCLPY
jgi:hypothetical protein